MMHRLTNTYPCLQEEGPAWAALDPAAGLGQGGQLWPPGLLTLGAFRLPSVEQERVCD
ncbi:hypothetical protein Nmel_011839 [Mimus melanotis]